MSPAPPPPVALLHPVRLVVRLVRRRWAVLLPLEEVVLELLPLFVRVISTRCYIQRFSTPHPP